MDCGEPDGAVHGVAEGAGVCEAVGVAVWVGEATAAC